MGGLFIIAMGLMFGLPRILDQNAMPASPRDPLQARHEYLARLSPLYSERINSIALLTRRPTNAVGDEILAAARKRLSEANGSMAAAQQGAAASLAALAAELSSDAGKTGLTLGPRMSPQLIEAHISNAQIRQRVTQRVVDFLIAACIHELLAPEQGAP